MIQKITDSIYELRTEYGESFVKFFLVVGSKYAVLIDSGIRSSLPELQELFRAVGVEKGDLKLVINTHGHWDHIGLNAVLKKDYGSLIVAHRAAIPLIEDHQYQWQQLFEKFSPIVPPSEEQHKRFWQEVGSEISVDIGFNNGFMINPGADIILDIIPTPGHSEGSICVYDPGNKILFSGDSIMGRGFFSYLSMYVTVGGYLNSLSRLNALDIRMLLSSHLPVLKDEKVRDFLIESESMVKEIECLLKEELSESLDSPDIKKITQKVCFQLGRKFSFHALFTIQAHINKLQYFGQFFEDPSITGCFGNERSDFPKPDMPSVSGISKTHSRNN